MNKLSCTIQCFYPKYMFILCKLYSFFYIKYNFIPATQNIIQNYCHNRLLEKLTSQIRHLKVKIDSNWFDLIELIDTEW